jgi:polyferredoxin
LAAEKKRFKIKRPWTLARRLIQILSLAAFVLLFITSRRNAWDPDLINIPMRLDPLTMIASAIASRRFLAGSSLALLTFLLTLVFGRAWCGWLCPLGTLLDLFKVKKGSRLKKTPAKTWRSVKSILLVAIITAALFTNLTLLIFDPLTILFRTFSTVIWPALDQVISALEATLYQIAFLQKPVAQFDSWIRPGLIPVVPIFYRYTLLYGGFFAAILGLNGISHRFWCRYLCPLGALLGWISRIAIFRREANPDCDDCGTCHRICPTGTIDPDNAYQSDPAECIMCMRCKEICVRLKSTFPAHLGLAEAQSYDPDRRQALKTTAFTIAGLAAANASQRTFREHDHFIQPPGARENDLFSKCIRCGECSRACPTSAIQPAISEAGIPGFWTPILIPRLGYCDYACNACGLVCPVEAIPPLTLEEKRNTPIGTASVDRNRCIAWSQGKPCIVCEEMCPVPEKAIHLSDIAFPTSEGETITLQAPVVDPDLCIGCGICENKCPVNGEAAIRVFTLQY